MHHIYTLTISLCHFRLMCNCAEKALRTHAVSQCGSHREHTANGYHFSLTT